MRDFENEQKRAQQLQDIFNSECIIKVFVVGESGIGKSTFIKKLCEIKGNDLVQTTQDKIIGCNIYLKKMLINSRPYLYQFYDLSGDKQYRKSIQFYVKYNIKDIHGIMYVFDSNNYKKFTNFSQWVKFLTDNQDLQQQQIYMTKIPYLIIGNKFESSIKTSPIKNQIRNLFNNKDGGNIKFVDNQYSDKNISQIENLMQDFILNQRHYSIQTVSVRHIEAYQNHCIDEDMLYLIDRKNFKSTSQNTLKMIFEYFYSHFKLIAIYTSKKFLKKKKESIV